MSWGPSAPLAEQDLVENQLGGRYTLTDRQGVPGPLRTEVFMNRRTVALFLVPLALTACLPSTTEPPDPEHVHAVSAGLISRKDPVVVVFTRDLPSAEPGRTLPVSPLRLSPAVAGTTEFLDERTLVFRPAVELPADTVFLAEVTPAVLGLDLAPFSFRFRTVPPQVQIEPGLLRWSTRGYSLDVTLRCLDKETSRDLEKGLRISLAGQPLPVALPVQTGHIHRLRLDAIPPATVDRELVIHWTNRHLGGQDTRQLSVTLPATGSFRLIGHEFHPDGPLILSFSQEIAPSQDWMGLLGLQVPVRGSVTGGLLEVVPLGQPWPESFRFEISTELRSLLNQPLEYTAQGQIANTEQRLPKVEWVGKGNILPPDDAALLPIKTVNLRGVVIEAIQIFDSNAAQFFQVNQIDGSAELVRVGRPVWREAVSLPWTPEHRNREVVHQLDLRPLTERFRSQFFHIRISFLPNQVEYPIQPNEELAQLTPEDLFPRLSESSEPSYWDDWWYGSSEQGSNPSQRQFYTNFYGEQRIYVSRNVLITHLGLSAKRTVDRNLLVWVTDLRTAEPVSGATIQVLDFQNQLLTQGRTDAQGAFSFRAGEVTPRLIIAEHQGRRSFLRVDEASALSVSHLDVSGDPIDRGLKGFLSGERGVWRPGDTIHLNFILLDLDRTLPPNHPVRLTVKDPSGLPFLSQVQTEGMDGFYSFTFATQPQSPTGNWSAEVTAGGRVFSIRLPVETIVPNRLRANLAFRQRLLPGPQTLDLTGTWLHGAPASNLRASLSATFRAKSTQFEGFPGYVFDDPMKSPPAAAQELWSGLLDAQGKTTIRANLPAIPQAPGLLSAQFEVSLAEPSGATSVDRITADYYPFDTFVGMQVPPGDAARGMLLTDTDHPIRLVVVDSEGRPAPRRRIRIELFKLVWRWWWDTSDPAQADFESRESHNPVVTQVLDLPQGVGQWTLRVNAPEWGRFYLRATDPSSGHSSGRILYIDWPGWAGRALPGSDGAAVLVMSSDKKSYTVGETAQLAFAGTEGGRALITIEGGGKILRQEWLRTTRETAQFQLRLEPGMAPNVYAHVSLIQPYGNTNQRPLRLYGSLPILVEDPSTRLQPILESADTFEPQSRVRVTVREASGRPMTYTLALVDEGLLGLTGFRTPDPWATFYRREASLVRHFDLFDFVALPFPMPQAQRIRVGGSGESALTGPTSLGRYPPLVRFVGPTRLAGGARNTHEFDIPLYVGAVRLMVVAASQGTAFGKAEKSVTVRKDLMVLGTLPRVLSPGETTDYPVTVFWTGRGAANVTVNVRTTGPASVVGESSRIIRFSGPGEQTVRFGLNVSGVGTIRATAAAQDADKVSSHDIEVESRNPNRPTHRVLTGSVPISQSLDLRVEATGGARTDRLTLEISRVIPFDWSRRLISLVRYPYGCVEQVTSAAFPQLYLNRMTVVTPDDAERIRTNVAAAIARLRAYQQPSGAFQYWPGDATVHDWANNYVGHFLLEARRVGYFVEPSVLSAWIGDQKNRAAGYRGNTASQTETRNQAYRLYLLAQAGSPLVPEMNRLREQRLDGIGQLLLAAAYQLAGQPIVAQSLSSRANLTVAEYRETSDTFGSALRDRSILLETLCQLQDQVRANDLAREVGQALLQPGETTTQETAFALVALARYFERFSWGGLAGGSYRWQGETRAFRLDERPMLAIDLEPRTGLLTVTNTSGVPLFVRVVQETTPPIGQEASVTRGVAAVVSFTDSNNRPLTPDNLPLGTQIRINVQVANLTPNRLENVALSLPVPAGWELINPRLSGGTGNPITYQDYRDDRVDSFFSLAPRQNLTLSFTAMVNYAGRFYLPALTLGPMYDPSLQAVLPGRWVVARTQ